MLKEYWIPDQVRDDKSLVGMTRSSFENKEILNIMCGICGQLNLNKEPISRDILSQMNQQIHHRGPDHQGFFIEDHIGLAMCRLSIIDRSGGDQPISTDNGNLQIVFNGEIYNFKELRSELIEKGYQFKTHSDTEVILKSYEEYGENCLEKLIGMFAFAIWDKKKDKLFIARDRLGQKPLYYYHHQNTFIFGSEIKTIIKNPKVDKQINSTALHHYLTLQYVPEPLSIFSNIHKLPAAHYLTLTKGKLEIKPYWKLEYIPKLKLNYGEAKKHIRHLIEDAVERRLISEVPLGAHLSGGIDSSIIVGIMAEKLGRPVKTFSIGFEEKEFNELSYASMIAKHYHTEHHEFIVKPDIEDVLPKMVSHFDEPFADPAALPTWYLSQMTKKHVTVALNGDGGDEAFVGYQRYYGDKVVNFYSSFPETVRKKLFNKILLNLPVDTTKPMEKSLFMALRQLVKASEYSHKTSIVRWGSYFDEIEKLQLYNPEYFQTIDLWPTISVLSDQYDQIRADNITEKTLGTDIKTYLTGALLPKVDRMTMAHSLEARSPFLDHRVMEFAAKLPLSFKLRGKNTKRILKDAFSDLLPRKIFKRGKVGFSVPLSLWFKNELQGKTYEWLLSAESKSKDYFNQNYISRLIEENNQNLADHGKKLWSLIIFEFWLRKYF